MTVDPFEEAAVRFVGDSLDCDPVELAERVRRRRDWRKRRALRPYKACYACGRDLPARAFAEDASRPDGLATSCRECRAGRERDRRVSQSWPSK